MPGAEAVVFAFVTSREAPDTAFAAQRAECVPASGEQLVRVRLVSDIEDELVFRGVEDIVDPDYQLHSSEAGSEMAGVLRAGVDYAVPYLRAQLLELLDAEAPDV